MIVVSLVDLLLLKYVQYYCSTCLKIILDLPFGVPINNIISLVPATALFSIRLS